MKKDRTTDGTVPIVCSTRLMVSILGFLGMIHVYACRVNLSVAIVCMLNNTAIEINRAEAFREQQIDSPDFNGTFTDIQTLSGASECKTEGDMMSNLTTPVKEGDFVWSKETQGLVLGSFFWGYLGTQIIGGLLSQWFGAKQVLGWSIFAGAFLTLITPICAAVHSSLLLFVRIVLGLAQGVVFPGVITLWTRWAPPFERSSLSGLTFAGCQVGNVIALPLAGVLCKHGFAGGWPSIFYVMGISSFVWFVGWTFLVSDTPATHRFISDREKEYIISATESQLGSGTSNKARVPWVKVLLSRHVWAILIGHIAADWGAYIMLTCLPSFMSEVLGFEITTLGFLASVPYVLYFVCINVAGVIADFLIKNQYLSIVNTRRLMMVIALGTQAVFLIGAAYCGCGQEMLVVALLTIGQGVSGFQYSGIYVNYIDIAPPFAGAILGIGNMLSCFSGILAPFAMGVMTPNKTREEWVGLFWLTFAILIGGTLFYVIFASGEIQPWARITGDEEEENPEEVEGLKEKYHELQDMNTPTSENLAALAAASDESDGTKNPLV